MEYDSVNNQKNLWPKVVHGEFNGKPYSYGWGDPDSEAAVNASGSVLGNYRKIKDEFLMPNIVDKTVLDLGCFDGKWTTYMGSARRVICADIDQTGYDSIKERLKWDFLEFYLCTGGTLDGIADASVDFVFTMDSLMRSERNLITSYISEVKRVLSPNGRVCMHLPAQDQHLSWELGFAQIGSQEILQLCRDCDLKNAVIDYTTVNHGILVKNF